MKIGEEEVRMIVVTDNTGRVIFGLTDSNVLSAEGYNVLLEHQIGDLRFINLEDGSIQAVKAKEGIVFPIGTMTSEQFIQNSVKANSTADIKDKPKDDVPLDDQQSFETRQEE